MTPREPAPTVIVSVTVNGETRELPAGSSITQIVAAAAGGGGGRAGGIAVALNDQVVRRADWAGTVVADGDRLEILTAVQGG